MHAARLAKHVRLQPHSVHHARLCRYYPIYIITLVMLNAKMELLMMLLRQIRFVLTVQLNVKLVRIPPLHALLVMKMVKSHIFTITHAMPYVRMENMERELAVCHVTIHVLHVKLIPNVCLVVLANKLLMSVYRHF